MANIYKSNYTGSQVDDAIGKVVNGNLQEKLTAGNNITISGNTISATVPTIPSITITNGTATTPTSDTVAVISGETASGHTITNTKVNVATKAYVDKKSVAAVQYLGTVSNANELAAKNPNSVGDFCRVAAAFGSYHAGDLLLCKTLKTTSAAATWDVIHGELDKDTWTANSKTTAGYVAAGGSNANKVWKTDASGNPAWRDDANTDTNTAHTHTVGSGLSIEGSGGISGSVKYSLKVASSSEIGGVKPGATSGKTYGVAVAADGAMTVSVPWENNTDSKVTSAANHYTPSAESAAQLSVDASSTMAATWNSTSLVTGVNIQRDSKGHVTGVTVDSIKMPANPIGALNIQNGSGVKSIQQGADPKYNGVIKAASKNPYAKVLYPELTDAEPLGAIGDYAASFGGNSSVQAKRGIGGGTSSVTKGAYSQSLGDNTVTTPKASDSTAIGYQTTTDAPGAFTHGSFTVVMSQKYIEGMFDPSTKPGQGGSGQPTEPGTTPADTLEMDTRRGEAASAGGFNSYSSGFAAEVDGVSNVADGHISKSSGRSNRSWSYLSKTDGKNSVVKPDPTNTDATGEGSWANGDNIQIIGAKYAYSGGNNNIVFAGADNSFSYGEGLQVKHKNQTVIGQYNDNNQDDIFEIGVGTSNLRKTSFRATRDGKVYYRDFEVSNLKATNDAIVSLDNKLTPKITGNTTEITKLWSTLRDTNTNLNKLNETKQATLVSGTNIKTINGNSLLGSGDLTIAGGGGDVTAAGNNTFTGSNWFKGMGSILTTQNGIRIGFSNGVSPDADSSIYSIDKYGFYGLGENGSTQTIKFPDLSTFSTATHTIPLSDTNNTFTGSNTFTFDETETTGSLYRTLINKSGVSVGAGPRSGIMVDTTYGINNIRYSDSGTTTTYTYAFPNKSGTFALTSDIPSTSNFVTTSGAQTISGNKTFNNHITLHNGPDGYLEVGSWKFFGYSLNNGTGTSLSFPSGKNGTIALTNDIDVTAAGNNTFTGTNTFAYNSIKINNKYHGTNGASWATTIQGWDPTGGGNNNFILTLPKTNGTITVGVKVNGTIHAADSSGLVDLGTINGGSSGPIKTATLNGTTLSITLS